MFGTKKGQGHLGAGRADVRPAEGLRGLGSSLSWQNGNVHAYFREFFSNYFFLLEKAGEPEASVLCVWGCACASGGGLSTQGGPGQARTGRGAPPLGSAGPRPGRAAPGRGAARRRGAPDACRRRRAPSAGSRTGARPPFRKLPPPAFRVGTGPGRWDAHAFPLSAPRPHPRRSGREEGLAALLALQWPQDPGSGLGPPAGQG